MNCMLKATPCSNLIIIMMVMMMLAMMMITNMISVKIIMMISMMITKMISVKFIEMMFKPHVLLQFRGSLLAKVTLRTQIKSTGFNVQCENITPSRKQRREKLQRVVHLQKAED